MSESRVPPTRWHDLKTDPAAWDATAAGLKTMEIRLNDRDFQVGDGLRLHRTRHTGDEMRTQGLPLEYVGEPIERVVTHVLKGPMYGLAADWVVMSAAPLDVAPHRGVAVALRKLSAALGHPNQVSAAPGQSPEAAMIDLATRRLAARAPAAPASAPEPWMSSYSAVRRHKDGIDYVRTTVAATEFQLYEHEARHLRDLLDAALDGAGCRGPITPQQQAVLDAASQWVCERSPDDWDEADLMKAVFRLEGDWPGCPECNHAECDEPCRPATVDVMLRRVDLHVADLIHAGKLCAPEGYTPPDGWQPQRKGSMSRSGRPRAQDVEAAR